MSTFLEMATRIATELRRSNLVDDAKNAINDAIKEAATSRFYFNEMRISFDTVVGQDYYDDLGLTDLDAAFLFRGTARDNIEVVNHLDSYIDGDDSGGTPQYISRYQGRLRIYPKPDVIYTLYVHGVGTLVPFPFETPIDDGVENEWFVAGEMYIRALAKRNLMRDIIRDYSEARVLEATAEDYKSQLMEATATKSASGTLRSTSF